MNKKEHVLRFEQFQRDLKTFLKFHPFTRFINNCDENEKIEIAKLMVEDSRRKIEQLQAKFNKEPSFDDQFKTMIHLLNNLGKN